jgi:hypothetical protein
MLLSTDMHEQVVRQKAFRSDTGSHSQLTFSRNSSLVKKAGL